MPTNQSNEQVEWSRLVAAAKRRAWVVITCAFIGAAAAFAQAATSQKQYTATSALLFQQSGVDQQLFGFGVASPVNVASESATNLDLVTQSAVAVSTGKSLGLPAGLIASEISAQAAGSSDVVNVSATDHSPERAAKIANAYAKHFISFRQATDRAQVTSAAHQLQGQITRLKASKAPAKQISDLQSRLSELEVLESTQTGDVEQVGTAQPPTVASSPKAKRDIALGLVAGLLIGLIAAFIVEQLDQSLRDVDDIQHVLDLPLLGSIPASRALSRANARTPSAGGEAETFRLLRTQLRYFNVDRPIKSIMVTSAAPRDGKSTIAWNLARESAAVATSSSVLLLDADLRQPTVATLTNLTGRLGLTELLTRDLDVKDVIQQVSITDHAGVAIATLDVLTAGAEAPNPSELVESKRLKELLSELHDHYDFIVVDAPPPTVVSDAIPLLSRVDGVIVVVRARRTRRKALRRLIEQLKGLHAHLLGVVVNDVRSTRDGYGYEYGYGYGDSRARERLGDLDSNRAKSDASGSTETSRIPT